MAWTAILGFVLFSILCLLAGGAGGRILRLAFPAGAVAVGSLLYLRYPLLYLGFTWWIWFLSPLVRRLIDYRSGWQDPSLVLLAPPLVTMIAALTFIKYLPRLLKQGDLPFILCVVSIVYSFLIGIILNSAQAATVDLLNWLPPVLLGFHIFVHWREYPRYRQNMQRTFLWGSLVMGAYGVFQYLVAPSWDTFWLENVGTPAFGDPEPLGIRVWSTMNSPQPFAAFMMAGVIVLLSMPKPLAFAGMAVGYLSFLLSLARSAWLGWFAGMFMFLPSLKPSLQMRIVIGLLVASLLVVPLATVEPLASAIVPRLESLSDTQDDGSYQARLEGYNVLLGQALSETVGRGLGHVIESSSLGSRDSGLLSMLFSLGWVGTIPYVGGLFLMFYRLFQGSEARFDSFASAARAIALGIFAQIGLNIVMIGPVGVILWAFLGVGLAASNYYAHQPRPDSRRVHSLRQPIQASHTL